MIETIIKILSNPLAALIAIFIAYFGVRELIFYVRKRKFLRFLYRYAFATKRPTSNAFYRNEDDSKRFFYSNWGNEDLRDKINEFENDNLYSDNLLLEGMRRILPNETRITYLQQDRLTKLFKGLYNTDSPKSLDSYYQEYNSYKQLPTIKFNKLIEEKDLMGEYFMTIPDEDEIKTILKSLNNDNIIDDDNEFWFVLDEHIIYDTLDWNKIITGGIDLVKKITS